MTPVEVNFSLAVAAVLFTLGTLGVQLRRNIIFMLLSIEVMFNAAALAFVAAGARHGDPGGQIMFFFILAAAAAEVAIGLALVLLIHRRFGTLDADALKTWEDPEEVQRG